MAVRYRARGSSVSDLRLRESGRETSMVGGEHERGRRTEAAGGATVAVVIASLGRPAVLSDLLDSLRSQTWTDFDIVLSVPDQDSLPVGLPDDVIVVNDLGSSAQRNRGVEAVPWATHLFFFDDDAVVRRDYLARAMAFFAEHQDVVALTGRVPLDGAVGDAIGLAAAEEALDQSFTQDTGAWRPCRELYGANFAYRRSAAPDQPFDERLPLYGWLEDHDFARRLMRQGVLANVDGCVIVHRGVKSGGRSNHGRLGYSQVMNPYYLLRKGSFPLWLAAYEAGRRVGRNVLGAFRPGENDWRRQRVMGNARAAVDIVRGKVTPERIRDL